jgi:radical SAM superfamily enzyme YgiQ (UPF0313 family)
MIGFPWETQAQMTKTADFATSLGLDAVSLFSATPLPGTELWEMVGGTPTPDSVDFRTPQVNVTSLTDDAYAKLFAGIKARMDAYNEGEMYERIGAMKTKTPISWSG